jgi:hypothetical protein
VAWAARRPGRRRGERRTGLDPALIKERLTGLEEFLQRLMEIPNIHNDKDVRKFLSQRHLLHEETVPGTKEKLKRIFSVGGSSKSEGRRAKRMEFMERDNEAILAYERALLRENAEVFAKQKAQLAKDVGDKWGRFKGTLSSKQGTWVFSEGVLRCMESRSFPKGVAFRFDTATSQWRSSPSRENCKYGYGEWDGSNMVWRAPTTAMLYQYTWWGPERRFYFNPYLHGPSQWLFLEDGTVFVPRGGDPTYAANWTVEGKVPAVVLLIVGMLRYCKSQLS